MAHSPEGHEHCTVCGGCDPTPDATAAEPSHVPTPPRSDRSGPDRWPMLASIGFFLVPTLLAIVGAALGSGDPTWQLIGAVAGLAAGTGLAVVVTRMLMHRSRS